MLENLRSLLIAKRIRLDELAHKHYVCPTEALKKQYLEALEEYEQANLLFNETLVEFLRMTNLVDVIDLYFKDNIDDERNIEDYHDAFSELAKLQMSVAKHSLLYSDYIEEELDDFYND